MPTWTRDQLSRIGGSEEVDLAPRRPDRSQRKGVTVWLVRVGDDLYVRSAVRGRDAAWYRAVQQTHDGRISGGGVETDVQFVDAPPELNDGVDVAYRSKYRRYAGRILNSCLSPEARSTTLRVVPR
jgi:hypothetical protein